MQDEYFFSCPYCGSKISMLLDLSVTEQRYIEDCEVCCRPVQLEYSVDEFGALRNFSAECSD
jgi:transcription elongation factor Elf1